MEIYPTPPSDFCKKLYEMDPNLSLNWDPHGERWSVWWVSPDDGGRHHVMNVMEPSGAYRPLDERTIKIIQMNRYYASHQKELEKVLVDDPAEELRKSDARTRDNIRHMAKDKALKRQWDATIEKARSIDWQVWSKPQHFMTQHPETGMMKKILWQPPKSLMHSKKPTEGQAEEMINATIKRDEPSN